MTTKTIQIFKYDRNKQTLTELERRLFFEQLGHDSGIEKYHFNEFNDLELAELINNPTNSHLPSVLLIDLWKHIILITKKKSSKEYSISTQFNKRMITRNQDMSEGVIIPINTQVSVGGIQFRINQNTEPHASWANITLRHRIFL